MIRRGATAAAIFLIVLMLVGAGSASAAPTGTISGAVTDGSANPLVGACVTATAPGVGFGSANTGAGGSYTITGLASGTYTVSLSACLAGNYAPSTITGVQVTDGQTTTQNATLAAGATIAGTVTDSSANPLSGACVSAIPSGPAGSGGAANTGPNGSYTITDLPSGSYRLVFRGCSAGDYQTSTITGVQATSGQTTTQNASLAPGGAISGHVIDSGANPLAGICLSASPPSPSGQGGSTTTDGSGAYTISGLAPGSYKLAFSACSGGNYAPGAISAVQVSARADHDRGHLADRRSDHLWPGHEHDRQPAGGRVRDGDLVDTGRTRRQRDHGRERRLLGDRAAGRHVRAHVQRVLGR